MGHTHFSNSPVVQVRDLAFAYAGCPVFANLNLEILSGLTLVTGDESSGKSTLLKLLAGQLQPDRGSVLYALEDAAPQNAAAAASRVPSGSVYWVDPRSDQDHFLTVQAYFVQLPTLYRGFDPQALGQAIEGLSLQAHLDKAIYMLSTGTRRKVWLAGAAASHCRLTLLDEPLAALDQRSQVWVLAWLGHMAQQSHRAYVVGSYGLPDQAYSYKNIVLEKSGDHAFMPKPVGHAP